MLFLPDPSSAFADQARPAIQPVRGGFSPRDQGWPDRLAGWSPARNHGPTIPPAPVAPHRPESDDRRRPEPRPPCVVDMQCPPHLPSTEYSHGWTAYIHTCSVRWEPDPTTIK